MSSWILILDMVRAFSLVGCADVHLRKPPTKAVATCEKKTCGWRNMFRIIEIWAVCLGYVGLPLSLLSFTAIRRHTALSPCLGHNGGSASAFVSTSSLAINYSSHARFRLF